MIYYDNIIEYNVELNRVEKPSHVLSPELGLKSCHTHLTCQAAVSCAAFCCSGLLRLCHKVDVKTSVRSNLNDLFQLFTHYVMDRLYIEDLQMVQMLTPLHACAPGDASSESEVSVSSSRRGL